MAGVSSKGSKTTVTETHDQVVSLDIEHPVIMHSGGAEHGPAPVPSPD